MSDTPKQKLSVRLHWWADDGTRPDEWLVREWANDADKLERELAEAENAAFPNLCADLEREKRELFAAMALQGAIASPNYSLDAERAEQSAQHMAVIALACADALLTELAKPPTNQNTSEARRDE